jgi:hypothetical protein
MITDLTPYRKYVDDFDLTDEQKLELVNALYMIIESIFDQHLGVNQLILKNKEVDSLDASTRVDNEAVFASERRNSQIDRCASAENDVISSSTPYGRGNVRACSGRKPKGVHDRINSVFLPPRSPTSSD